VKYHHYRAYQIGGLHVQFYEDAPFFDLNFNPNTVHLANDDTAVKCLQWLLSYLRASVALYNVRIRRVDYTFDVPCEYDSLYVYSRKNESHYKSTRYYGDAKCTGRLRVYDKTLERMQKAKIKLDKQITRCEWIQRNEKPFTFDSFFQFFPLCKRKQQMEFKRKPINRIRAFVLLFESVIFQMVFLPNGKNTTYFTY
jgi:hypothetical protein